MKKGHSDIIYYFACLFSSNIKIDLINNTKGIKFNCNNVILTITIRLLFTCCRITYLSIENNRSIELIGYTIYNYILIIP